MNREEAKKIQLLTFRTNPHTKQFQPENEDMDDTMKLIVDKIYDDFEKILKSKIEYSEKTYPIANDYNRGYKDACGELLEMES